MEGIGKGEEVNESIIGMVGGIEVGDEEDDEAVRGGGSGGGTKIRYRLLGHIWFTG